jgi:hypothetical protein
VTYRSTFIYLLVVILFLGFTFLKPAGRKSKRGCGSDEDPFCFPAGRLTRLSLAEKTRRSLWRKRMGETGRSQHPCRTCRSPCIEPRQNTLAFLKYLRIISKDPRDLSEFGLDPPNFVIILPHRGQGGFSGLRTQEPGGRRLLRTHRRRQNRVSHLETGQKRSGKKPV